MRALLAARQAGIDIVPVWNKSHREHTTIGTHPADVRAEAGGEGLDTAKDIYAQAFGRFDELCGPYATVIDIDQNQLPVPDEVRQWDGVAFAAALRHDPSCPDYNLNFRQLLHVAYKIAAETGDRYLAVLRKEEASVAPNVTGNIYQRHLKLVFGA